LADLGSEGGEKLRGFFTDLGAPWNRVFRRKTGVVFHHPPSEGLENGGAFMEKAAPFDVCGRGESAKRALKLRATRAAPVEENV